MSTAGPRYPTTNAVVNTGWINPTYAYNADGVQLATGVPARNTAFYSDFGGFGFDALIPAGATINSVLVEVYAKCSAQASQQSIRYGPMVSGVRHGSEQITNSIPVNLTLLSQTWTGMTRDQLLDSVFKIRLGCYRTNTTSYTFSVDYVRVTVDYTLPTPVMNVTNVDRSRISDEAGADVCTVTFQSNVDLQAWEARAGGSGVGQGTLVGSGGALAASTDQQFTIDNEELVTDGSYRITVYGQDLYGQWSAY